MLKAVVFDMDGLMLDTEKLLTRFWCEAANFYGYPMKSSDVLGIRSLSYKFAIPHLQKLFGKDFDYWKVRTKRIELMNDYIDKNSIDKKQGLDELLEYLKTTDLKLAVATATDTERTRMYLKKVGVYDYFDEFVCGNMVKTSKPAPDIYIAAAKALNVECGECIALEDSPNGIKSAYDAGCIPVMVPDLSQPDEETKKLLFAKCDNLSDVIDIIKNLIIKA